jgi:hypothetical protein
MPPQGNMPRFAQIYVYNPEQDEGTKANTWLGHMTLPWGTTTQTKDKVLWLLTKLWQLLRKCNPYIQDCIQVCEIPADQVETMELVISPTTTKKTQPWSSQLDLKKCKFWWMIVQRRKNTASLYKIEDKMEHHNSYLTSIEDLMHCTIRFSFPKERIVGMLECHHQS